MDKSVHDQQHTDNRTTASALMFMYKIILLLNRENHLENIRCNKMTLVTNDKAKKVTEMLFNSMDSILRTQHI